MTHEQVPNDPRNRDPDEGFLRVEQNALRVLDVLPLGQLTRTRDAIQIDEGDETGITVLITAEAIEFRLPTVEWTMGAYGPASASRLWKRVRFASLTDQRLRKLIVEAGETRRAEFIPCRYCQRAVPLEHRHGDVCHGCAERYEGIVH